MARFSILLVLTAASALALSTCEPTEPVQASVETPVEPSGATGSPCQEAEPAGLADIPCRDSIGEAASAGLVERCIAAGPATRPPCNALNPCPIHVEIDRRRLSPSPPFVLPLLNAGLPKEARRLIPH